MNYGRAIEDFWTKADRAHHTNAINGLWTSSVLRVFRKGLENQQQEKKMARDVRNLFCTSLHQRVAAVTRICLLFCPLSLVICVEANSPQSVQIVDEILVDLDNQNTKNIEYKFDLLANALSVSDDPLNEERQFLQSFVVEINSKYKTNLTIHDAYLLIRQYLPSLQIPEEIKRSILYSIENLESASKCDSEIKSKFKTEMLATKIIWPWELYWLGLNKKDKKRNEPLHSLGLPNLASTVSAPNPELPGNIYAGSAEILAGALLIIISEVCPPAGVAGWGLIGDGSRRVLDGVVEMSEERRKNGTNSSGPFSVEF